MIYSESTGQPLQLADGLLLSALMERISMHQALESVLAELVVPFHDSTQISWRDELPVLAGTAATLRELRASDAAGLLTSVATADVSRLMSPPPSTAEGFEKFIAWTRRQRAGGRSLAFGVVPHGSTTVAGLFQVRALDGTFHTAEWGFALGSEYWGTGVFGDAARLVAEFVFDVLRAHRLEARVALRNDRGNGALHKLGARQEALLRRSFLKNGEYLDQVLWSILAEDWRRLNAAAKASIIH